LGIVFNNGNGKAASMPMKFTVTVTSVGTSSVIVVPKPVLEGFGLKKGDTVNLLVTDSGIYIPLEAKRDKQTKDTEAIQAEIAGRKK
jgi:bifunctional DNA-binding transcriptional regulator/antitoxin component of YhaV-PrlF toxin-antitoxin module